ncbi:MAG: portal protein [Pseudomonadota bacterium]
MDAILKSYHRAGERRAGWETHWQECYDFALPHHNAGMDGTGASISTKPAGGQVRNTLYDGTAPDAVDQLAASLLSELTPPWSRWFGLSVGTNVDDETRDAFSDILTAAEATTQSHFDQSNFTVELHQAFLDLVTVGTACIAFEEQPLGNVSAFHFRAIPLWEIVLDDRGTGQIDTVYRAHSLRISDLTARFPEHRKSLQATLRSGDKDNQDEALPILEVSIPDGRRYRHIILRLDDPQTPYVGETEQQSSERAADPRILMDISLEHSPFIAFRWMKTPGEIYGRSPVMKALPDIKTANKIVELTLKNASIAVSGIWQADDDGVLNPATISLTPGTIIPKAVGSAGLQPLRPAGQFDISQLMLDDFRTRIRHALLADQLAMIAGPQMTATEVVERSVAMARILGATYGRLQSELLSPIIQRALAILRRRGAIPDITADGRWVALHYRAPLAQAQAQRDLAPILTWLQMITQFGPHALTFVDIPAAIKKTAQILGVPDEILLSPDLAVMDVETPTSDEI